MLDSSKMTFAFISVCVLSMLNTRGVFANQPEVCSLRYEYRNVPGFAERFCQMETCRLPLNIAYFHHPPYVYRVENQTEPRGLLVEVLKEGLETCCRQCHSVTSWTHIKDLRQLLPIMRSSTLVLPVAMPEESISEDTTTLRLPVIGFIKDMKVAYAEVQAPDAAEKQLQSVLKRIGQLWPIVALELLSTIVAGVVIWLMDTWFNREDFPRSFLRGTGEGTWWAFVSMTTVGYGDKTPRSFHARVFAAIWILFGISVSSVLTASFASILTTASQQEDIKMAGKNVCVYFERSAEISIVHENGGSPLALNTTAAMEQAMNDGKCAGVAMESHALMYHWDEFNQRNVLRVVDILISSDETIGITFFDHLYTNTTNKWVHYLSHYFHVNRDHRQEFLAKATKSLPRKLNQRLLLVEAPQLNIFDASSPLFKNLLLGLGYVLAACTTIGAAIEAYRYLGWGKRTATEKTELKDAYATKEETKFSAHSDFTSNIAFQ